MVTLEIMGLCHIDVLIVILEELVAFTTMGDKQDLPSINVAVVVFFLLLE